MDRIGLHWIGLHWIGLGAILVLFYYRVFLSNPIQQISIQSNAIQSISPIKTESFYIKNPIRSEVNQLTKGIRVKGHFT